jgi:hypothetical protein
MIISRTSGQIHTARTCSSFRDKTLMIRSSSASYALMSSSCLLVELAVEWWRTGGEKDMIVSEIKARRKADPEMESRSRVLRLNLGALGLTQAVAESGQRGPIHFLPFLSQNLSSKRFSLSGTLK